MRKPDDDLKIDIADLFGGELGPSDALNEETDGGQEPAVLAQSTVEKETQFQEWRVHREKELEAKSQEIERKIQEASAPVEPPPELPSIPEIPVPPEIVVEDLAPEAESLSLLVSEPSEVAPPPTVDFNAPMVAPFMGPTPASAPVPEAASAPAGEAPAAEMDPAVLKKLQADHEFLMFYDEFRNILAHELKDLVGEKKTNNMLGRTVELAREKFPEIFRNANWDPSGNLLEDGSMDSQRLIDNKNALEATKADLLLDAALSSLLNLRLQAVEKGLGTGLKNKVRSHMFEWVQERTQKAVREGRGVDILKRLQAYVT